MADGPLKRQREETEETHVNGLGEDQTKRLKPSPQPQVLSFLDDQLDDGQISSQELSSLISALQDELASDSEPGLPPSSEPELLASPSSSSSSSSSSPEEESDGDEDKEKVLRHLLVASDDELGLPSREDGEGPEAGAFGVELLSYDGLWELEDEAANYYTLLQSELFM